MRTLITLAVLSVISVVYSQSCSAGTCPPDSTCCALSNGQYGCCPYANAICCADHLHCCPQGYTCDVSRGECIKSEAASSYKANPIVPVIQTKEMKELIPSTKQTCPAGTCPSADTCCLLAGGQWGCCPYLNADCCADHLHCCPQGYTCDVSRGECIKSEAASSYKANPIVPVIQTKEMKELIPSTKQTCPAGTCPSADTCCLLAGGQWGCCPYLNADCCADHLHCCPQGYTCNTEKGECTKNALNLFDQVDSVEMSIVKAVTPEQTCPAGTCSPDQTCCQINGGWGCCPYANADCCADHSHCCPQGYTCDVTRGECLKTGFVSLPHAEILVK
eukprot:TRINITY_DN152_c0_g1_i1.p1 TRINITY_DN152_c0_g1~~TRINITY_DN152_c0_g1_i1.p1  ORF type:complete len:333 (-),score=27.50 TRINITY_DN152_c0_g1_i1:37-1035(-)